MDPFDEFLREHPLTESVDVLLPDLAGVLRGKRLPASAVRRAIDGEAFFTTTVYSIDTAGANVSESGLVWEEGDADRVWRLDPSTVRPVPWRPGGAQMLSGMAEADGSAFYADCRWLVARLAEEFAALGLAPVAALEFEFYLIDATSGEHGAPLVPRSDRLDRRSRETEVFAPERMEDQEAFFELVERYGEAQELPIKGALCEFAPGQFEINLGHVDDMVLAADQGVLLKRCIKAAARATGQRATFMAKPYGDQSGSGLHIHLSLLDGQGRNLFGETPDGERQLGHAVRGLQDLMAESMLVFAPNANSYRRLRPLTYAPTAPTWGWNNRTVALRIPPGGPSRGGSSTGSRAPTPIPTWCSPPCWPACCTGWSSAWIPARRGRQCLCPVAGHAAAHLGSGTRRVPGSRAAASLVRRALLQAVRRRAPG